MDKEFLIIFSALINLFLGFTVYRKEKKNSLNRSFFLFAFSVFIWSLAMFFYTHPVFFSPLEWIKITYLFSAFIVYAGCYFILVFSGRTNNLIFRYLNYFWIFFLPLVMILFFTDWWVKDVIVTPWGYHTITGPAYLLFGILVGFYTVWCFYILFKTHKKSEGIKKLQIRYIFIGAALFGIFGFVVDVVLPIIGGISRYFWLSPLFSFFLIGFTALAILRYHLFEIRIILTEILVGIMGLVLLILPFLMPTSFLRMVTVIFLLLFIIFAYLLIKTTYQEIKRREAMEKLTKELQKAYRNIKALSKMKSEFLKVVNHQLRTPVSIVKGMLSMMDEGSVKGKKLKEFIKKAYISSERLSTILDDILTAQDLIAGEKHLEVSPCNIQEIVENQVKHFKSIAKQKKLKLILEKSRDIFPLTLVNSPMIERVVSRVIDNAILYTPSAGLKRDEKGKIRVSLEVKKSKDKRFIQISVKDSGLGLTKEDKKNLFKLFHRGEEAISLHPNGSGLGLFIVKNLVELHKGTIRVKSEGRGKGTTFIIRLPIISET